jgi:hypothetical protein
MKMIYLTYGEPPSGVYSGQVCDVVNHLKKQLNADIRLVAFISIQQFSINKQKIKSECPDAVVFPMLPKAVYWRMNIIWLWMICLFTRPKAIIARNVIATNMALKVKSFSSVKKVCFDGRGAIAAEWNEYEVTVADQWKKEIDQLEKDAVINTDCRIAVSSNLVHYWKERYGYNDTRHAVIPCTISSSFLSAQPDDTVITNKRTSLGYTNNDVLFAYSGSTAGWQSFSLLKQFLDPLLQSSSCNKVLFLAKSESSIEELKEQYPAQVKQQWLSHNEVRDVLASCDYGVLIRENTVTNQVASPTKFAEYLACGLPVIISDHLGDYSAFVEQHRCGTKLNGSRQYLSFSKPTKNEKLRMTELVRNNFTKNACNTQYRQVIDLLSSN